MNEAVLAHLNRRFSASGRLHWRRGAGAQVEAVLDGPAAHARLTLQGGQLLEWIPRGAHPVLWLSPRADVRPGRPIRGGVPVCWPWFGPHPRRADFPAHGFARTAPWFPVLVQPLGGGVRIVLELTRDAASYHFLPASARLSLEMILDEELRLTLITRNEHHRPLVLSQALHAYFAVSDVRRVSLHGLEGVLYHDKIRRRRERQRGALILSDETDRVFLRHEGAVVLHDPGLGRRLLLEKRGARSTVVWNPWERRAAAMADVGADAWRHMLCVEAADALDDTRTLLPAHEHHLTLRCRVLPP